MGAHGSKEKLTRSASERFVHAQVIERERFGSFGKRIKKEGKTFFLTKKDGLIDGNLINFEIRTHDIMIFLWIFLLIKFSINLVLTIFQLKNTQKSQ